MFITCLLHNYFSLCVEFVPTWSEIIHIVGLFMSDAASPSPQHKCSTRSVCDNLRGEDQDHIYYDGLYQMLQVFPTFSWLLKGQRGGEAVYYQFLFAEA